MDADLLLTREQATTAVKRNRRTIGKALADVPPDDPGPPARWRESTILAALGRREAVTRPWQHPPNDGYRLREQHADRIESLRVRINAKFARLAAEPDPEKRFELAMAQGLPEFGDLDRALTASLTAVDPILAPLLRSHCNEILRQTLGTLGELLDLDFTSLAEEAAALPAS